MSLLQRFKIFASMIRLQKSPVLSLGRWNLDRCPKKIETKVHFANEDHCFCNEYIQKKLEQKTKIKSN